jgi:hypothetical protein
MCKKNNSRLVRLILMLERSPDGVPFRKKERRLKKLLLNGIVLTLILFFASIAINQIQLQSQPKEIVGIIYRTAHTATATTTLTFSASVGVVVRSANGTIISNSTGG